MAKRAGFSLDEARVLLATGHGGPPAHAQLRELAERKLPEVDELIARAQAMREWLVTASGCDCDTLDVCGLFDAGASGMTAPTPAHSRLIAGGLVRVLLVEDDHGDAFLVSELLREEGAPVEVHRAQSLAEGLALLASEPFDCVLLDLGLPDASGLVALERLREAAPHLAHLVLTGDRDDQRGIDAVAAGAQDYIVKGSLGGDGLRRAILYAVERRQADSVRQQLRPPRSWLRRPRAWSAGCCRSRSSTTRRCSSAPGIARAASGRSSAGTSTTWCTRPTAPCTS